MTPILSWLRAHPVLSVLFTAMIATAFWCGVLPAAMGAEWDAVYVSLVGILVVCILILIWLTKTNDKL